MSKELKDQVVKLKGKTMEKLKNLYIETTGVELTTYDDKINYLIWFLENNSNNEFYKIKNK